MAGTSWGVYNLPAICAMLEGENACTGADRVLAWESLATSVRDQHRRLVQAGEDLAAVWPPERNDSALAFLRRIDELAASMKHTLACAEQTRDGLRGIVEAIAAAQTTIGTLRDERATVSTDWVPRFVDHAEDEYDERAQRAMRDTESAIGDHSTQIKAPDLYVMGSDRETRTGWVLSTPVPVPHDPVLGPDAEPDTGRGSSAPDPALGVGPGLSGVSTPPPAAPPPQLQVIAGSPGPQPGVPPAVIGGSGALGLIPAVTALGAGGVGVPVGPPALGADRQAVPMRRALPSGAVIGGNELGAGQGGWSGRPATQASRDRRRGDSESTLDGDADEQWQTIDGVTPVIAADATPVRHDPGPGVLGFGR